MVTIGSEGTVALPMYVPLDGPLGGGEGFQQCQCPPVLLMQAH